MTDWHSKSEDQVFEELGTSMDGLSAGAAERRLNEYGANDIQREDSVSPLTLFLDQFRDFLIYLLIIAAVISLAVGFFPGHEPEYVDAALIMLILFANGVFGFVQDYKAEKSIEALKDLSTPEATVLRDGMKKTVDSTEVVPGDIVFIEQGDSIPADARVLETSSLETDESALTGESAQVSKDSDVIDTETPLAERDNMVFMNTTAVKGRGKAVVVDTGMETEVGSIATQLEEAEDKQSPFQQEVDELGKKIGYGIIAVITFVAVTQLFFTNASILTVLLVAITLAVAAVPEGLPAVVTLTLALGSKKMLKKNALVRRLPVVESLGSVDMIVTDKTGTLTEDTMTVKRLYFDDDVFHVTGGGVSTDGSFRCNDDTTDSTHLAPLLRAGMLCNNAEPVEGEGDRDYFGDPTEVALLVAACKADATLPTPKERENTRKREVPFSSERKRMTTIHHRDGANIAYMKGAPEVMLNRCNRILIDGEEQQLTDAKREEILKKNEAFAEDALRVLAFAYKPVDNVDASDDEIENNMVFLGLQGMIDPPRAEVQDAVQDCRNAGIHVVMATGDNIETAKAVGKQVGFNPQGALTGADVEAMTDQELADAVQDVEVFARVSPDHKVRILQALQGAGHNVAMTGDGVNDAPALKNSDVGIAMGVRGTDVAKQASDMILQDDNFVTIRDAIAEGRGIFDNIRKFVSYLLSYNAGEVLLVFFGVLLGSFLFPDVFSAGEEALILTPVMLLWINLVTDGLPALALGADPKVEGIMERPPRGTDEPVIDKQMLAMIGGIGVLMTATILPFFFINVHHLPTAQTVAFTALVVFEMIGIQAIRKIYGTSLFSNTWLWVAIAVSMLLQLVVLYTPLSAYFETVALPLIDWAEIGAAFLVFLVLVYGMVRVFDRVFAD